MPHDPIEEQEALDTLRRREVMETWVLLLGGPVVGLVGGLSALLIVVATTTSGRALGLSVLSLAILPFLGVLFGDRLPRPLVRAGVGLGLLGLCWVGARAPEGGSSASGLRSEWPDGPGFWRFGLANLTPEADQAMLASWTMPLVDAHLDLAEAATFRGAIRAVYAELEADVSYASAGSVQGLAYHSLLIGGEPRRHLYVDLPAGAASPMPAAVFLHGFGGNLKGYSWVLRDTLHRHGYAIVAPSYGSGAWYIDGALVRLEETLDWMRSSGRFDMERVVLIGLSNGGFGVTLGFLAHPERWRGVAWISGVIDAERMPELGRALVRQGQPPALILHGARDDRVPLSYIQSGVRALESTGAAPRVEILPEADHFLMFKERPRLNAALDRWLSLVDTRGG